MKAALLLLFVAAASAAPQNEAAVVQSVRSEPVSIIFDTKRIIVNPGMQLHLDCGVSGEYRYCHWEKGPTTVLQVQDVHDGVIDGLRKPDITQGNECGIVINSVTNEEHGAWTCKVFVVGNTLTATKNVTVTIRPTQPLLEVPSDPLYVSEGEQQSVTCSVAAARPMVAINWYLGDEDITYNSKTDNSLTDNMGTYKSISTLTQVFKAWHNNKQLRCSVAHYTLELPIEDYVDINVRYKPWGKDVRLYGIRLGDDVEATVDFSSNPLPLNVKWGYGTGFEEIQAVLPVPGEEGRYSTEVVSLDQGHYTVILRVLEFTEMDAHMNFKVAVENELGVREFRVTLSNDKPPNEPLSSGILAIIVIVVACTLLLLLCCVYTRYNHLYCFAKKKPLTDSKAETGTNNSDTESTRSPPTPEAATQNGDKKKNSGGAFFAKLQGGLKKPKLPGKKSSKAEAPKENGNSEDNKNENGGAINEVASE